MVDHKMVLEKVISILFPDAEKRGLAVGILERYGSADWQREADRVRLGILKLAGTNLEMIQYFTVQACRDYRDILASAEYPNQMANPFLRKNDPVRARELEELDQKQYEDWYLGIIWGTDREEGD
jgi:hypothetical protein